MIIVIMSNIAGILCVRITHFVVNKHLALGPEFMSKSIFYMPIPVVVYIPIRPNTDKYGRVRESWDGHTNLHLVCWNTDHNVVNKLSCCLY